MKRKVTRRIYKYTCDECGWEAYRGEILPMDFCSKCGNTKPPKVSTEDKEFEFSSDVEKAVDYLEKFFSGADPEEIDPTIFERKKFEALGILSGCWFFRLNGSADPVTMKVMHGHPVVY